MFRKFFGELPGIKSGVIIVDLGRVRLRTRQMLPSNPMQHRVGGSMFVSALNELIRQSLKQIPNVRMR